ncbi:GPP34 family phosphoprotein [Jannaschia sp. R86511]|uniref:GOLPH3/VPS74 family protein n=1 Tax=Jannaschia sp. R86511 TaxID=3093853 RepID=UPI0036D3CB47
MDTAVEVFLLLTSDEGGPASWGTQTGWALSAASIADLLIEGRLVLEDGKDPRVRVVDTTPTGSAVLDRVMVRAAEKNGARLSTLVQDRKLNPEDEVVQALKAGGVVDVVPRRMLGLVPEKRPTLDPQPEREIRDRLRVVLAGGRPAPTDATILAILQGLGVAKKVLAAESMGMSSRGVQEAASEIAVGSAIKRAIDSMNAAILTAVIVPIVVSGGSS